MLACQPFLPTIVPERIVVWIPVPGGALKTHAANPPEPVLKLPWTLRATSIGHGEYTANLAGS
jgi:hypothetical protein